MGKLSLLLGWGLPVADRAAAVDRSDVVTSRTRSDRFTPLHDKFRVDWGGSRFGFRRID